MTPEQIKQLRQHLRLTQTEFAAALKVSPSATSHWERGKHAPSPDALRALKAMVKREGFKSPTHPANPGPLPATPKPKRERTVKPATPGQFLQRFLEDHGLGWTLETISKRTGYDEHILQAVINDERPITPNLALKLGEVFGTSAKMWLNLQDSLDTYERRHAKKDARIRELEAQVHALRTEREEMVCAKALARDCMARDVLGVPFTSAIIALGHKLKLEAAGHMRRIHADSWSHQWEFDHEGQRRIRVALAQGFKGGTIDDGGVTSFKLHTVEGTFTLYR